MFRAVIVIAIGSFAMAVIVLQALEIPGSTIELAFIATLITAAMTGIACMATRFTTGSRRSKARRRARRVPRLRRELGADGHGVAANLPPSAVRHR